MNEHKEVSAERLDPKFIDYDKLRDVDVRTLTSDDLKHLEFLLEELQELRGESVLSSKLWHHIHELRIRYPASNFRLTVMVGKPVATLH